MSLCFLINKKAVKTMYYDDLYEKTKIKDNKFIKIIREVVSKILMAGIEMQNEYKTEDLPLTIESEVREKCNN